MSVAAKSGTGESSSWSCESRELVPAVAVISGVSWRVVVSTSLIPLFRLRPSDHRERPTDGEFAGGIVNDSERRAGWQAVCSDDFNAVTLQPCLLLHRLATPAPGKGNSKYASACPSRTLEAMRYVQRAPGRRGCNLAVQTDAGRAAQKR